MATATLASVPATISTAESITGWTGDTFSLEPDIKVQGSNSVACALTSTGANDIYYTGFTAADLSTVHLRMWFNISFVGNLSATTPIQAYISDGTNTAYWEIDATGYAGGWKQIVFYTGNTPTSGTKPTGNSTRVGILFTTATKPRNVPANAWFDAWYYGDGFTAYGGTSGDEISWTEIAIADAIGAYGVVSEVEGVYFLGGAIQVGDGTNTTYFKDAGQIAVFKDLPVLSTLYDITFFDDASNLTNVDINGGAYSAAGTQNYTVDASITDLNAFTLAGKQFSNASTIDFADSKTITTCVFDSCGQVDPSTSIFNNNSFSNYVGTTGALLFPSDDTDIDHLTFINCDNGVEYGTGSDSTTPSFRTFTFDDAAGNFDVNNTSGVAATIDIVDGGNANSYNTGGSTVTFNNFVYHALTNLINDTEVTYLKFGTATETGTAGATTADSRTFTDGGKSWTTDVYKGMLLLVTSGSDIGRYYIVSNLATTLKLDTEMTTTGTSITYSIQNENDMTSEYHVENVTGNATNYGYNYTADFEVDIIIHHVNYEQIVLTDVSLGDTDQSIPITQIGERVYYNPT